jgi:hypothetical protein
MPDEYDDLIPGNMESSEIILHFFNYYLPPAFP